jgi:hypothetical protein
MILTEAQMMQQMGLEIGPLVVNTVVQREELEFRNLRYSKSLIYICRASGKREDPPRDSIRRAAAVQLVNTETRRTLGQSPTT